MHAPVYIHENDQTSAPCFDPLCYRLPPIRAQSRGCSFRLHFQSSEAVTISQQHNEKNNSSQMRRFGGEHEECGNANCLWMLYLTLKSEYCSRAVHRRIVESRTPQIPLSTFPSKTLTSSSFPISLASSLGVFPLKSPISASAPCSSSQTTTSR